LLRVWPNQPQPAAALGLFNHLMLFELTSTKRTPPTPTTAPHRKGGTDDKQ
jgi:hypothetical protein